MADLNQPTTGVNPAGIPNADIASALSNPNAANLASPQITPVTPTATRNPGESITDFTNRLDGAGAPTSSDPYKFTSELDFYSKTGLKNMSGVQVLKQGQTPNSDYYKYEGNPQVYSKKQFGGSAGTGSGTGSNSVVGTSEAERAKARADGIAAKKAELDAGATAPTVYKSQEEYQKLRTEQGVVKDEEELSSIRNEAALAKEELNKFKQTSSAGMPEGGYLGGISEAERNLNFRLESLSLRENAVVNRLNSKNAYISTMVNLGVQDYQAANTAYTAEYNKNVKAIEMYNTELDNDQKDALTGFTTIANLLKDKDISMGIDPKLSQQLDTLALKAGLPTGIFQSVIKAGGTEKILTPVTVDNASGGKDLYFYTQGTDGVPHLKKVEHLTGDGNSGGLTPSQLQNSIDKVTDDYRQDQTVKDFVTSSSGYNFMANIDPNSKNPGDNIGLIYAFAKIMDPGSVVREGEYATVQKYAQSWLQTFGFNVNRILNGSEFLSASAVKNMQDTGKAKYTSLESAYKNAKKVYDQRITDLKAGKVGVGELPDYSGINNTGGGSSGGTIFYEGKNYEVDANGDFDITKPLNDSTGKSPLDLNKALQSGGLSFDQAGKPQASINNTPVNAKFASALVSKNPAPYGIINGYDITNYATDPGHEKKVYIQYQTLQREGVTANNPTSIDKYITSRVSGSPIKGSDVVKAAKEFNVDPLLMVALMQIDSSFGTQGKAVKTKNPGNVGNTDSGGTQGFSSWYAGIRAVAQNISKRRYTKTA